MIMKKKISTSLLKKNLLTTQNLKIQTENKNLRDSRYRLLKNQELIKDLNVILFEKNKLTFFNLFFLKKTLQIDFTKLLKSERQKNVNST